MAYRWPFDKRKLAGYVAALENASLGDPTGYDHKAFPDVVNKKTGAYDLRQARINELLKASPAVAGRFAAHHAVEAYGEVLTYPASVVMSDRVYPDSSHFKYCECIAAFPSYLRDRLDAAFYALRRDIDPDGFLESGFEGWEHEWSEAMRELIVTTRDLPYAVRGKDRLRRCREDARAMLPTVIDWFHILRDTAFGGGAKVGWPI